MKPESIERRQSSRIFPLGPAVVNKTIDWMEEHLAPDTEPKIATDAFWGKHSDLFIFTRDMANFRKTIYGLRAIQNTSYERGLMYSVTAYENKLKTIGQGMKPFSQELLLNYFESLLTPQQRYNGPFEEVKTKLHLENQTQLDPHTLNSALTRHALPNNLQNYIASTFIGGTQHNLKLLRDIELPLEMHLRRKSFHEPFGPNPGLAYGTVDGYMLSRLNQEVQQLDNILQVTVK